jgi:hypothetical protein
VNSDRNRNHSLRPEHLRSFIVILASDFNLLGYGYGEKPAGVREVEGENCERYHRTVQDVWKWDRVSISLFAMQPFEPSDGCLALRQLMANGCLALRQLMANGSNG